ncbi:hypothetical protein Cob_v006050 [Colletotrichum orbiculare MAFF 240422]|uniref:Uncharacterized protein n=1 Tax=Colletotrichum orbiculare (strain 104-T / ATCC 96160 / CBS 514.97 / LARS 414 / MAFF 240422) TaxID=1213857 RepID=A0A484FV23_COLOR|nr:hypothetical protein Cob_v006050 [Colletotrichum orbiculare MAFF 240422]
MSSDLSVVPDHVSSQRCSFAGKVLKDLCCTPSTHAICGTGGSTTFASSPKLSFTAMMSLAATFFFFWIFEYPHVPPTNGRRRTGYEARTTVFFTYVVCFLAWVIGIELEAHIIIAAEERRYSFSTSRASSACRRLLRIHPPYTASSVYRLLRMPPLPYAASSVCRLFRMPPLPYAASPVRRLPPKLEGKALIYSKEYHHQIL